MYAESERREKDEAAERVADKQGNAGEDELDNLRERQAEREDERVEAALVLEISSK